MHPISRLVCLSFLVSTLLFGQALAPAVAEQDSWSDAVGDTQNRGLDITRLTLKNREEAVVSLLSFKRIRRGVALVVLQDDESAPWVAAVSKYRGADRRPRSYMLTGPDEDVTVRRCANLSVHWRLSTDSVRFRVPWSCMVNPDSQVVRASSMTEQTGGSDTDDLPAEGADWPTWLPWVARGTG